MNKIIGALLFTLCTSVFASSKLNHVKNFLVYYGGDWSSENIARTHDYQLLIVHGGPDGTKGFQQNRLCRLERLSGFPSWFIDIHYCSRFV
jgi:hypothetical protein